jgi:hypothetical protein
MIKNKYQIMRANNMRKGMLSLEQVIVIMLVLIAALVIAYGIYQGTQTLASAGTGVTGGLG